MMNDLNEGDEPQELDMLCDTEHIKNTLGISISFIRAEFLESGRFKMQIVFTTLW